MLSAAVEQSRAPRERPIPFSGAMIRAILEGKKTQTRRVLRLPDGIAPSSVFVQRMQDGFPDGVRPVWDCDGEPNAFSTRNPFGDVGDRLWVKEAIRRDPLGEGSTYIADGVPTVADAWPWKPKALPSMFCPKGLSRITLEITSVRVQPLQDISEGDAKAEGVTLGVPVPAKVNGEPGSVAFFDARTAFAYLWNSINGKRPGCAWKDDPWVWAIGFRVLEVRS